MKKTETGVPANKKKYVFYDQLSFLLPHVKGSENTASNIAPPEEQTASLNEDGNESEVNRDTVPPENSNQSSSSSSVKERLQRQERLKKRSAVGLSLASTSKNLTSIMQESLQIQKAGLESDKFGNKAFLLSFVPTKDNFPPNLAFDVRMQITDVFRNAIERASYTYIPCDTPGPSTGYSQSTSSSNVHQSSDPGRVTPASSYISDQSVDNPDCPSLSDPNSQHFNLSDFIQLK